MGIEVVTRAELELAIKQLLDGLMELKKGQQEILNRVDKMLPGYLGIVPEYIPAMDFMKKVGIERWKFNQLMAGNLIKTIKKKRKIYVLASEVRRYFLDPEIQ
jgi:hypothetical protein